MKGFSLLLILAVLAAGCGKPAAAPTQQSELGPATPATPPKLEILVNSPKDGSTVTGTFKFDVELKNAAGDCVLTWQVHEDESTAPVVMQRQDGVFEADVDVSGWNWRGKGPYRVRFTVKNQDKEVLRHVVKFFVDPPK